LRSSSADRPRHREVGDDDVRRGRGLGEPEERVVAAGRLDHLVAEPLERGGDEQPRARLVVGDQHPHAPGE
jgi:hypothetical protein